MIKFCTFYISLALGIILCTGSIQAKPHEASALSLEDAVPFQCLLNIPMGISPGELKYRLESCENSRFIEYSGKDVTDSINISDIEANGQLRHGTYYIEANDTISDLFFNFLDKKLYSISGEMRLSSNVKKEFARSLQSQFGKPKQLNVTKGNMNGDVFKVPLTIWNITGKYFYIDLRDKSSIQMFDIIDDDGDYAVQEEILYTKPVVFAYNGYDQKEKQYKSDWYYAEDSLPSITTQCEGVGKIVCDGRFNGVSLIIQCENGKVVFKKDNITLKKNTVLLKKGEFPYDCEGRKIGTAYDDQEFWSTRYVVTLSKRGYTIFRGIIERNDCFD